MFSSTYCLFPNCIIIFVWYITQDPTERQLKKYECDHKRHSKLYKLLYTFDDRMQKANVTYFLTAGSLIGSLRHHGVIPWDSDIDVLVNTSEKLKINETLNSVPDGNFYLSRKWNGLWRYYLAGAFIDLWFYDDYPNIIEDTWRDRYNKANIFPLVRRPFGNRFFWTPCNPTKHLAHDGYDISQCQSKKMNVPCEKIRNKFPFVERVPVRGSDVLVDEVLVLRGKVLNTVRVDRRALRCK